MVDQIVFYIALIGALIVAGDGIMKSYMIIKFPTKAKENELSKVVAQTIGWLLSLGVALTLLNSWI